MGMSIERPESAYHGGSLAPSVFHRFEDDVEWQYLSGGGLHTFFRHHPAFSARFALRLFARWRYAIARRRLA
jgi:hypothetical protein